MTKKTDIITSEYKIPKELTPEQQAQAALLVRQVQIAEDALRDKLELAVAKKASLNAAQNAYTEAYAQYEKGYAEIVALQKEIAAIG